MAITFKIYRDGNKFFCTADGGPKFFVGRRVPYDGNIGLYNVFAKSPIEQLYYSAANFSNQYGFWANFVEPTAKCEGRNFLTLNTYDSAAFTFGFGQFAAHVPNGDFVQYFRTLLQQQQEARDYFPHLEVVGGHICSVDGLSPVPLESDASTKPLMEYLNPNLSDVQDPEVIAAAKFIHWTSNHVSAQSVQVSQMITTFRSFMVRADKRVGINNRPSAECCVIADILHHGRGGKMTWPLIDSALKSTKPFDALVAIGAPIWNGRKEALRKAIKADAAFPPRRWSSAQGDFV